MKNFTRCQDDLEMRNGYCWEILWLSHVSADLVSRGTDCHFCSPSLLGYLYRNSLGRQILSASDTQGRLTYCSKPKIWIPLGQVSFLCCNPPCAQLLFSLCVALWKLGLQKLLENMLMLMLLAVSWVTKCLSLTQEVCVFGWAFMKHLASKQCKLSDLSQYLTAGGKFCFLLKGKKKKHRKQLKSIYWSVGGQSPLNIWENLRVFNSPFHFLLISRSAAMDAFWTPT